MAPISVEDQFTFLISCIRHSDGGKVDFQSVANECSIISKGAAAKRYERLMKAHGIHSSQTGSNPTANNAVANATPKTPPNKAGTAKKAGTSKTSASKKRKLNEDNAQDGTNGAEDEGEDLTPVKQEQSSNVADGEASSDSYI